jgi:RNA polymerase sigma-70 factor (ECF subfamily)
VRRGEPEAWAALAGALEPRLRQAADRWLGAELRSEANPADLTQAVHWSLWLGLGRGKYEVTQPEQLMALALTILRRKISAVRRRLVRQRRLAAKAELARGSTPGADRPAPREIDPLSRLAAEDHFAQLCQRMSATERRLVELRWQGYSTAEAARLMGRDPASLRVVLQRLRDRLKSPDAPTPGPAPAVRHAHVAPGPRAGIPVAPAQPCGHFMTWT